MSALPSGRMQTGSPHFRATPATRTWSSVVGPSSGFQLSITILPARYAPETSAGSMQRSELFRRQVLRPLQQCPAALVEGGHGPFFFLGQRLNSQGEDLIDLGGIEQVTGTLWSELRIVVK